ncbi:uncharacterized protein [Henckelia pumila]|uniref:uncharacterized protein n=1 Tax=Henckelia pumila TaxID=405737 RepID=UPI003C6DEDD0
MDGQSEALNKCLETYFRCFATEQPKSWANWIHWSEYWYNTSFQSSAGMTPFEAVYGRKPPTILQYLPQETLVSAVANDLSDRDELLRQLKYNLQRAQQIMVKNANKHRRDVVLQEGDWKAVGNFNPEPRFPSSLESDFSLTFEPENIVDKRYRRKHGKLVMQVLVQWKNRPLEDATWELADDFQSQFPAFGLEDNTIFEEEGIVTGPSKIGQDQEHISVYEEKGDNHEIGPVQE